MPNCPFCAKNLTEPDITAGVCPSCGERLPGGDETALVPGQDVASPERIEQIWGESITAELGPGMTIREKARVAEVPLSAAVKLRDIVEAETSYELLEVLGEGGMGVVYTARQGSVDRTIALKMLKGEVGDAKARAKFLCEAAVTGNLEHPNIVPLYDVAAPENGTVFYAMKQVKGARWKDVIAQRSQAENIDIFLRVADAVAFAHSKGVIHRDLKPENVMLGDFGEVLVMDWGLALSVFEEGKAERITMETVCAGTPVYMAPEMASASAKRISPASDIYLLGAILYEIVTGRPPHTGRDVRECILNAANNIIQPTEKKGELVDIARKAMATDRARRYWSVKEFQTAIQDCQSHSESISLSARAQEDLERAEETRSYDDFAKAAFGFREALELWPGNAAARDGVWKAGLSYARCAFAKGDLDLAASLLDTDTYEQRELLKQVTQAQKERRSRQRRMKTLTWSAIGLGAAVILVLAVAFVWVNAARREAVRERDRADALAAAEAEQHKLAEAARKEAREEAEAFAAALSSVSSMGGRDEKERRRIRIAAVELAARAGMKGDDLRAVRLAADLMDVGRATIADALKKDRLTMEDLQKIMEASQIARELTGRVRLLRDLGVPDIVGGIWESWDGKGYPNHLAGEKIPLGARVLRIAWVHSVMLRMMRGPDGKQPPSSEQVLQSLQQQAGASLDPVLVGHFVNVVKSNPELRNR